MLTGADQDKHLEVIEQSVLRSKEIAVAIGSEAKDQIKLVEEARLCYCQHFIHVTPF